jgi:hypothetical protein
MKVWRKVKSFTCNWFLLAGTGGYPSHSDTTQEQNKGENKGVTRVWGACCSMEGFNGRLQWKASMEGFNGRLQ